MIRNSEQRELMSELDIHALGIEVVHGQLVAAGWSIGWVDVHADPLEFPQIAAMKEGELGFFVVRTGMYPERGRIEGEETFQKLVRYATSRGGSCYFASVSLANSEGKTEEEMAIPVKGVAYHAAFDGLVKMELPPAPGASA